MAVVLLLSTSTVPEVPRFSLPETCLIFFLKWTVYLFLVRRVFGPRVRRMAGYLKAEQKGFLLAVGFLALDIFLLDINYFLADLPLMKTLPALQSVVGLMVYFSYLLTMWIVARPSYVRVTGSIEKPAAFLAANLKINLALLLPWISLSLVADGLLLIKYPPVEKILASEWGSGIVFFSFFLILLAGFPAVMVWLWGCTPLPAGKARDEIEHFCRQQRLRYREIFLWPLFGGRMLTAGVLGIIGRFRYLLITPALLESLTLEEVRAVMAHEAGHVKRFHMPLFLFILFGLSLLLPFSAYPGALFLLWQPEMFLRIVQFLGNDPGKVLTFISMASLLVLVIIYVRFLFGFFMRNFERQADVYSAQVLGGVGPLVRVFEKIAMLSGSNRDAPSWHHFGIGQRVAFLLKCQDEPGVARRHDLKVYLFLAVYGLCVAVGIFFTAHHSAGNFLPESSVKLASAVLEWKVRTEPGNYLWHQSLGDLQVAEEKETAALSAYETALSLAPDNGELLNNFAWLLVTADDPAVRDLQRGLILAQQAAALLERGFVLDTLATALWMNGQKEEALAVEMRAIKLDPDERDYYRIQMERFLDPPDELPGH